jgi:hypothetical protein
MGETECGSRSKGGCSDSIVAGLVVGQMRRDNGECSVVVDAGDAQLHVFSSRNATWPGEGTHVFIRLMWADEKPSQELWTRTEDDHARVTLCTVDDVRHNDDHSVFAAPTTIPVGTVLALRDMDTASAEPIGNCLREMLVISPSPTTTLNVAPLADHG